MAFSQNFNVPSRKPVPEYLTPVPESFFYSEQVENTDPAYQKFSPIPRGTLYSSIFGGNSTIAQAHPNLRFVKESRVGNSDKFFVWSWAEDEVAADSFNAEVTYGGEGVPYPIYGRVYRVQRTDWDAGLATLPTGQPLGAIIGFHVTVTGSGYVDPTVLIENGAQARAVLNAGGGITSLVLTAQGDTLAEGSDPIIQFVEPLIVSAAGTSSLNGSYTALDTLNDKVRFERDGVFIYWTAGNQWEIGNDTKGYYFSDDAVDSPDLVTTWGVDTDGALPVPSVVVSAAGTGATATAIIQPQNALLVSQKKVEYPDDHPLRNEFVRVLRVYETLPGPLITTTRIDEYKVTITTSRQRMLVGDVVTNENIVSGVWIRKTKGQGDAVVAEQVIESRPVAGVTLSERVQWDERILEAYLDMETSVVAATDSIPANTATIMHERHRYSDSAMLRVLEKRTYNVPALSYIEYPDQGVTRRTLLRGFYSDNVQGTTRDARQGFSEIVPHRVTRTFSLTATPVSPYQFFENNLLVFDAALQGLMDAATLTKTVNGTPYTQPIPASVPSLTAYNALVSAGAYHVVGGGVEIRVAKIYQKTTIEVIFT